MFFEFFAVVGALFSAAFVAIGVTVLCLGPKRSTHRRLQPIEPTFVTAWNNAPHNVVRSCVPVDVPLTAMGSDVRTMQTTPVPVYPVVEQAGPSIAECQHQLTIEALDAAAAFGTGDMHAAKAIVEAASATQRDASLDLYVVAGPCAGMPGTVVTLASMRRQWPRLFEHGDPDTSEGTKVWSLMLLPDHVRFGRVVVHRVVLDRATLDAEFGPREDPLVARLRSLVPAVPPPM
ncbi:hypothetical protein pmac_cds_86 [Pandoravirus macleodensis]|uniref:Uncharacterized protein n=1 Tax=Pandoravirus macleodensis TaxID=2107707 RepID=A0A2U7UEA7_9VIRU|nr:hypothetical protein pmac_cds_86 [Pandoravirus macleodensis]AVK76774.1 hypothetical protein pmac_cds_86 [Pandoravirus macleodensis]UMO79333.1 hypothetical protein [Pandoravirus aubagnensis]